ncbi:MAG: hypothetical protein PHY16_19385 [Methylobacter sp.]|nr:hypothetical protein [Methylobacter sp.]
MYQNPKHAGNVVLIRGAALWLLVALVLAWCLVLRKLEAPLITMIFKDFDRLLQGHIDFLLMSALIFGFYGARVPLPWSVRWAMVIGAFTNSSLFLMQSIFPGLNMPSEGLGPMAFRIFLMMSITLTTYGFGMGALVVFRSTLETTASE